MLRGDGGSGDKGLRERGWREKPENGNGENGAAMKFYPSLDSNTPLSKHESPSG
jgi:hypothetical protein